MAVGVLGAVLGGGAMLLAVTLGRALALATVTRIRASGFEMVWSMTRRVTRVERGEEVGCHVPPEGGDLLRGGARVHGGAVDELEWPGADPQRLDGG